MMGQSTNGHTLQAAGDVWGRTASKTYVRPIPPGAEEIYAKLPRHIRPPIDRGFINYGERAEAGSVIKHELWAWFEQLLSWIPGRIGMVLRGKIYRPFFKKCGPRLIVAQG